MDTDNGSEPVGDTPTQHASSADVSPMVVDTPLPRTSPRLSRRATATQEPPASVVAVQDAPDDANHGSASELDNKGQQPDDEQEQEAEPEGEDDEEEEDDESEHSGSESAGSPPPEDVAPVEVVQETTSAVPDGDALLPASASASVEVDPSAPPASTNAKPKSSRVQKPRSPSPVPPPPPPPPLTVRLDIELGGPSGYNVNILELAKETGQRHPTPPPVRRESDSESDGDEDRDEQPPVVATPSNVDPTAVNADAPPPPKKRRRRKRNDLDDYYDVTDPFIDDADLGIDAPTHFAQTKQKGFYVNSGDVTLVLDEPEPLEKKKRKRRAFIPETPSFLTGMGLSSQKPPTSTSIASASASTSAPHPPPSSSSKSLTNGNGGRPVTPPPRIIGEGTRDSPIALLDDGDARMSDGTGTGSGAAKRLKLSNGSGVGVGTGVPIAALGVENGNGSGNGNGDNSARKRKSAVGGAGPERHQFSASLQEAFSDLQRLIREADFTVKSKFPNQLRAPLASVAIRAVELEEYGEGFFKHLAEIFPYNKFTMTKLTKRLIFDRHLQILNNRMDVILENLRQVVDDGFPAAQRIYKEDVAKWEEKQKRRLNAEEDTGTPNATSVNGDTSMNGETSTSANTRTKSDTAPPPPQQRFKLTDEIKNMIWQLVTINNEMAAMTNVMHEWEPDAHAAVSDQSMRKNLYQRIVGAFPDGWMNTGLISREFSNMKRKVQMAGEEQGDD